MLQWIVEEAGAETLRVADRNQRTPVMQVIVTESGVLGERASYHDVTCWGEEQEEEDRAYMLSNIRVRRRGGCCSRR